MKKKYNVFVQWHENTNNYKRFDGGLQVVNATPKKTLIQSNGFAADWLYDHNDNYSYNMDALVADNRGGEVAVDIYAPEPACYDFGDGTIYVAEVVE